MRLSKIFIICQMAFGFQLISCHLTIVPFPEMCPTGGCQAGGYGFYGVVKVPHSQPGMFTYKISMKIPNSLSATIKPQFTPGWAVTYDIDNNPNSRWIHMEAYPGFEFSNDWVFIFQLQIAIKCGTFTAPLAFSDSLIVPMGTASDGTVFYGALFPSMQYLCVMTNNVCVPNGKFELWSQYSTVGTYNSLVCGNNAQQSPGTCNSACKGSTVPCFSFYIPNTGPTGCGNVSIVTRSDWGNTSAVGEGGDFPPVSLTRALSGNPFGAANPLSAGPLAAGNGAQLTGTSSVQGGGNNAATTTPMPSVVSKSGATAPAPRTAAPLLFLSSLLFAFLQG